MPSKMMTTVTAACAQIDTRVEAAELVSDFLDALDHAREAFGRAQDRGDWLGAEVWCRRMTDRAECLQVARTHYRALVERQRVARQLFGITDNL